LKSWRTSSAPIGHYLARVKARMIEENFPPGDELFQMVE